MKENLKVLMINGSPKSNGNTSIALREMEKVFKENGVDVETVTVGNKAIRGCVACNSCYEKGKCVFDDIVNELAPKFEEADGLVVASPVYYASPNATLVAFLDRLFYSSHFDKTMKVGASIACARRGGCSATFDELNKYFTISGMPIASGILPPNLLILSTNSRGTEEEPCSTIGKPGRRLETSSSTSKRSGGGTRMPCSLRVH